MIRRMLPWLAVWGLAAGLAALTTAQSLALYRAFRSGWPWDLAYNNQWFWAIVSGDRTVTVYPVNFWAMEGPSVWVRTHLDPIRLLILPIYALIPGPETLIAVQNAILWCTVPAAFGLVRSESGSTRLGLLAALLVPMTPQLWPLAWNDFREMELALPFILWAVEGCRARRAGLTAFGIAGMLACREEYGLVIACLAILPPKRREEIGRTYRWSLALVAIGIGWMLLVYFAFESVAVSHLVPWSYMRQFGAVSTPLAAQVAAAIELCVLGIGPWCLLAILAPRLGILGLLWIVEAARDRWAAGMLATPAWHFVRYTTPAVALMLAAGLVGFARVGEWLLRRQGGRPAIAGLWVAIAAGLLAARAGVVSGLDRVVGPIPEAEARAIQEWIGRVAEGDGVVAAYEVAAPLSSRRHLYSDVLDINRPPGFPRLVPEIRWAFLPPGRLDPNVLIAQGFEVVYRGETLWVYHRSVARGGPTSYWPTPTSRDFARPDPLVPTLPFLVPALALALASWLRLGALRRRLSVRAPASSMTGAETAAAILGAGGAEGVAIARASGPLADFYDLARRELRLSDAAFDGRSPAALAVAAHEASLALLPRPIAALRTALVFAISWAWTAGWIALASGFLFVVERLALWGSLLVAASAFLGTALTLIGYAAIHRARGTLAAAGLGGIVPSWELDLAPLTAFAAALPRGGVGKRAGRSEKERPVSRRAGGRADGR